MSVTSSKKIETNKYELEIAVNGNPFYNAMDIAFKKNSSKISIPGFRRGKAPRSIIEKMYGKEVFLDDAINEIYPRAYQEAIEELKLEPVDRPDVEILTADADGFTFKAIVTVKPEVEVKDYKGLKAEKTVRDVSDKDVENEIKKLAERNARTVTVEDRAAKLDDITNIDFEGFVNDVAFEGGKGEGFSLTLGSGQFIPGFEDQIVGHNIGDEFDVNVTFPEVYHSEELAGKAAVFKVKLNGIQAKELPEIDDEFAKDVSEFDAIADLKADISKKLTEQNEKISNEELENDLIASLVDNMTAEIPQVMFDNRVED
ncbi:MAG: trigger factor, partial [Oscillospiraceae bacterium]|nr:trigger factor [Oscillospiraceae bacterium]